jgi:hypothetical protein
MGTLLAKVHGVTLDAFGSLGSGLLAPLGLVARPARQGGRQGRFYLLDAAVLSDLATRYNPAAREPGGTELDPETRQPALTSVTTVSAP